MSSLRGHRDFTLLWVGQTLNELGSRVSAFAFPLVAFALTGSPLATALAEAVYLLGLAGALLPGGVLADRVDRGRLLRASCLAGALAYASLAAATLAGHLTYAHLLVAGLVSGLAAGVFMPAETSALRSVVAADDLPRAMSLNQGRQHVAGLVGGPLGGVVYGLGRAVPFVADAASYAVAWVLMGRLRSDLSPTPVTGPRRSPLADVREGLAHVVGHPLLRVLAVYGFAANLAINALFSVALLRLVADRTAPTTLGLVSAAAGAAGVVGALLAARVIDRVPTGWLTITGGWAAVLFVVPMALWPHPVVVGAALVGVLLPNPAGNAGMSAYRMAITPPELVGRVSAAMQVVSLASLPLAPVLAGALLSTLGGRDGVLLTGGVCALAALVPTLSRTVRAVPRPAAWPRREAVAPTPEPVAA